MQITAVTALLLFNMEIKVKIDENTIAVISTVTANNKTIFIHFKKAEKRYPDAKIRNKKCHTHNNAYQRACNKI